MNEILPNLEPETKLYGDEKPKAPQAVKPQGVMDQFRGVFTEPAEVFRRLRVAPSWVGAFVLTLCISLFATWIWAAKVDMAEKTRHQFEVMEQVMHNEIPAATIDMAMEKAATQGKPFVASSLGVLLAAPLFMAIMAGILFAFSKFGGEDDDVTFAHAWSAIVVHGLAMVPITLLAGIMCLIRNVGGAASFASMAPTTLVFWLHPENPWLRGFLAIFDPFYLFSFVALYLAARYTMRLKTWAIVLFMVLMSFFGLFAHFVGGIL